MYGISKLLLNSLYGRFGLNPDLNNYYFLTGKLLIIRFNKYNL